MRRIIRFERSEVREDGAKCITRSYIIAFITVIIRKIKLSACMTGKMHDKVASEDK